MAPVAVKNKYQVVIPRRVREQIGVAVGDLLEARAEKGRIVFEPKSVVDRGLAESFADFEAGRTYGPFATAAEAVASMKRELAKRPAKSRRNSRPR
ncbi:MAG: AbrB/MazE/SpoVT family DNA-binding domain-containing protein [Bryobacteraceae bacterium]|jgi:AbrB family looped-hinge helix DNA binding protein